MYNVMLVDDEPIVLNSLKKRVPFETLGYQLVAMVESFQEAMDVVNSTVVHVIITDIVLVGENGLDLLREVNKKNSYAKFIIVSGHGIFDYAVEAMQLGCVDFIKKPVDITKLNEALKKTKQLLDQQKVLKYKMSDYNQLLMHKQLNNLIRGVDVHPDANGTVYQKWKGDFVVVHILVEDKNPVLHRLLEHLKWHYENKEAYFFETAFNQLTGILTHIQGEHYKEVLAHFIEYWAFHNTDGWEVYFSASSVGTSTKEMPVLFKQAEVAMNYRMIKGYSSVVYYEEVSKMFLKNAMPFSEMEQMIMDYLDRSNYIGLKNFLEETMQSLLQHGNVTPYAEFLEIIIILNKYANSKNIQSYKNEKDVFRDILKVYDRKDLLVFMNQFIDESIHKINNGFEHTNNLVIEKAKRYIDHHYNENINLNTLSEVVFVTPTYLSKLFLKIDGNHFIDYLTNVRIEKSKVLLKDVSLRIYDVASLVGYESAKHFSKIFKEKTGKTPKEYRDGGA